MQREQSAFHLFSFLTKQKFFILSNTKLQMAVGMSVCVSACECVRMCVCQLHAVA